MPRTKTRVDSETHCDCNHRDTKSTRTQYHQASLWTEEPLRGCLLHGLGDWVGVPQFVVSNLPHQPHLPLLPTHWNLLSRIPDQTRVRIWGFSLLCPVFRHKLKWWIEYWTDYNSNSFSLLSFPLFYHILSLGQNIIDDYYLFIPFTLILHGRI